MSDTGHDNLPDQTIQRTQPLSPHIQIYRPQLTSVLSIGYRISGVALSFYAAGLVVWLIAAAAGLQAYSTMQAIIGSWPGQLLMIAGTFAFFWHLCGGIRHLAWDMGHGFELRTIYLTGWAMVAASVLLTLLTWAAILFAGAR